MLVILCVNMHCFSSLAIPNKQLKLAQAAKDVSQALNHMVNCLPGVIEYENAIKAIAQASLSLQNQKVTLEHQPIQISVMITVF